MTFDILKDRKEWYANNNNNNDEKQKQLPHSVNRQVVELLAEQIEAASIVIVNKQDLATTKEVQITMELTKSLNKDANIIATSNGKIPFIRNILLSPSSQDEETISLNDNDDDDDSTSSSPSSHSHSHHDHNDTTTSDDDDDDDHEDDDEDADCTDSSHSHSHDDHGTTACDDADCTDPSHSHSHVHDDHVTATCDDTDCTDLSHSHSHEQDHSSATTCNESDCTDPSHSHSHDDYEPISCDDADCADPSHSHSHTHDHSTSMTSTTNLGISNFVYKASKPFNANRLMKLIWSWPIPIKDELDFITLFSSNNKPSSSSSSSSKEDKEDTSLAKIGYGVDNDNDADDPNSPFIGVLRSKGFCWIAPTAWEGLLADGWRHDKAMYWSHAGKHMGIQMGK
jgi:G3E family GTPase